ncbi:MAG: hypothetical protein CSA81_12420 [Acidobacteria bacterium]|nr:MAG: hypothetical protein CSA81_12420 [Acidobacteriota bacterium]
MNRFGRKHMRNGKRMKVLKFFFILLVLAPFSLTEDTECYIQIKLQSTEDFEILSRIVQFDEHSMDRIEPRAYTLSSHLPTLRKIGYEITVLPHPGINPSARMGMLRTPQTKSWDSFPTYAEYVQIMQDYAANYPDICRLYNIGSTTNTNRPHDLWVVKITEDPDTEQDEPEVFYTSTMHGDETTGYVTMLHLIEELLTHYDPSSADPYDMEITHMIQNMEIWINPLANPDGTYRSSDSTVSGAIRNYTTSSGSPSSVDPNRNFPDPEGGDHPDGNPYWAETVAMMNFAEQNHFVISSNIHGGAEVVNYPWDTWSRAHADDSWYVDICLHYAGLVQLNGPANYYTSVNPNGITNGYAWYPLQGGRQDYMNFWRGCRETTNEISNTKNPAASTLPTYWDASRQALLDYLKESLKGVRGIVTSSDGTPLDARIEVVGYDVDMDQSWVYTDPAVGDYHRMLLPGTYTLRASAYGYVDAEVSGIVVVDGDAAVQDFVLQQAETVTVTGVVRSTPGNTPLAGATIELLDTPISPVTTSSDGSYSIEGVLEGTYTFRVTADEHKTLESEEVITTANVNRDFTLVRMETYYFDNFESGPGGLSGTGIWEHGVPSGSSPQAYSGDHVWATNLSGNYGNNEGDALQIENLDIPSEEPQLFFMHYYDFESGYDGGRVEIAVDGGGFAVLTPVGGYPADSISALNSAGYDGTSNGWVLAEFDLSAYAGQTVTIRWYYASDSTQTRLGWYIDDLEIKGKAENVTVDFIFSDGFESGDTSMWDMLID